MSEKHTELTAQCYAKAIRWNTYL